MPALAPILLCGPRRARPCRLFIVCGPARPARKGREAETGGERSVDEVPAAVNRWTPPLARFIVSREIEAAFTPVYACRWHGAAGAKR